MEMVEGCGLLASASIFVRRRPTVRSSKKGSSECLGNGGGLVGVTFVITLASETRVVVGGVENPGAAISPSRR
jgi:hypothetical protein